MKLKVNDVKVMNVSYASCPPQGSNGSQVRTQLCVLAVHHSALPRSPSCSCTHAARTATRTSCFVAACTHCGRSGQVVARTLCWCTTCARKRAYARVVRRLQARLSKALRH